MNTIKEEFDAVIKINKLDDYRLRPKRYAPSTSAHIDDNVTAISNICSSKFEEVEKEIYEVIKNKKTGIKAKDIADKLRISRSEVNHYLYGTLNSYVKIDDEYKWHVVESETKTKSEFNQLASNKCSTLDASPINLNLLRNEDVASYINMFDKLVVSHRNGLNAPHKYILLISIFSLMGNGLIKSNQFGSTKEIEEEFNNTWNRLVPKGVPFNSMYTTPFWHLASERFWNVYTNDGNPVTDIWNNPIMSVKRQRKELVAIIDLKLYNLILNNEIRRAIISHLESIVRKGLNLE